MSTATPPPAPPLADLAELGPLTSLDASDALIAFTTLAVPFLFASRYLIGSWLFKEYELKRAWVGHLFSSTFALSLAMLALACYEIVGVLQPAVRWLCWRVVMYALTFELVRVDGGSAAARSSLASTRTHASTRVHTTHTRT